MRLLAPALILCALPLLAIAADTTIAIIPEPVSLQRGKGSFTLPGQISIAAPATTEAGWVVRTFSERWQQATGNTVVRTNTANANIRFVNAKSADNSLGKKAIV